ncbi:MAG: DUF4175 family protein, partial [Acidimicrobiales bacterium]
LLGEQRQLRDETQEAQRGQQSQDGQSGQQNQPGEGQQGGEQGSEQSRGPQSGEALAESQESLRELLEKLEEGAGKELLERQGAGGGAGEDTEDGEGGGGDRIDEALEDAKRGMRQSEEALKNSEFYAAGEAQSEAIEALRQLGEELYAEEAKRMGEQNAEGRQSGDGDGSDPFGRENDGNGVGDEVEVPDIDDRQRARDLLEELRRRSGEQDRDKIERDYLDRLLERF